jgi:hypothetical protein
MEKYIISNFKKWIHFLKKIIIRLVMRKLTLGYSIGLGVGLVLLKV